MDLKTEIDIFLTNNLSEDVRDLLTRAKKRIELEERLQSFQAEELAIITRMYNAEKEKNESLRESQKGLEEENLKLKLAVRNGSFLRRIFG